MKKKTKSTIDLIAQCRNLGPGQHFFTKYIQNIALETVFKQNTVKKNYNFFLF